MAQLDHLGVGWEQEHATVRPLVERDGRVCVKCNDRSAVVELADGVLADEEVQICAVCLFAAVEHYPERDF